MLTNEELLGSNIKSRELVCFVSDIMGGWKMLAKNKKKIKTLVNLQNNVYSETRA